MKTKNIVMASILLVVAIVIGSLVATYFSYNNREIALRQQAEAQRGKIEGVHDKMWKIIKQKAQVTDEYKQIANAVTSKVGHGISDPRDGLGNSTPYIIIEYD